MVFDWNEIKNGISGLKDLTAIGSANTIVSLISGIFWFYIASQIGTEQYGKVSYLISIATIAATISSFGATNTIMTFTAKEQKIQTSVYFLVIVLSMVGALALFFVVHNTGVSLLVFGTATFGLVLAEQLGRKLYKNYSKYMISQRILLAGLGVGLYFLIGPEGIILGFALSYFPYLTQLYNAFRKSRIELSTIKLRLGFMANSYSLDLTGTLVLSLDKLIVYPLFGFALLGNYQLGMQFLMVLTILPSSVYQFILPREATGLSNKKLAKAAILISIVFAILGILFVPKIIPFLFPQFKESIEIIQIMSLAIVPATINVFYSSKFFALERSRLVLFSAMAYLGIQALAIFVLGKLYGINGAAAAPVLGAVAQTLYLVSANRAIRK